MFERLEDMLATQLNTVITVLTIIAVVFIVIHLTAERRAERKRRLISKIKETIHRNIDVKAFSAAAGDAAVMAAASAGLSLFDIYVGADSHEEVLQAVGDMTDAAGSADGAAGGLADLGDTISNGLADMGENVDVSGNVPAVALALLAVKTTGNLVKLARKKQTGREAGINMGLDATRIGVGGAGAYCAGKLGALIGSAIAPGLGTLIGGGLGVFAGSFAGSYAVGAMKNQMKWGHITEAQEYFGRRAAFFGEEEFINTYVDSLFDVEEIKEKLAAEKEIVAQYQDELNPYKLKKPSVEAVLSQEYVDYLSTQLEKATFVRENLYESMDELCDSLSKKVRGRDTEKNKYCLMGEMMLSNADYLMVDESERQLILDYQRQKAVSLDYPCRFDVSDGESPLEALSMELFDSYEPAPVEHKGEPTSTWSGLCLVCLVIMGMAVLIGL